MKHKKNENKVQSIDVYEKKQKKSRFFDIIRGIVVLLVAASLAFAIYYFREELTAENAKIILSYFDFSKEQSENQPTAQKITFIAGADPDFKLYQDSFCVYSGIGLFAYNEGTKEGITIKQSVSRPVMETGGKFALLYGIGESSVSILSGFDIIKTLTFDYPVTSADMNGSGYFAVVSSERGYKSMAAVYSRDIKNIFSWATAKEYISEIELNQAGSGMAAATISLEDKFSSTFWMFDFSKEEPFAKHTFEGEIISDFAFKDQNIIGLFTNKGYYIFNSAGELTNSLDFKGETLWAHSLESRRHSILLLSNNAVGGELTLKLVDNNAMEIFSKKIPEGFKSLALSDQYIAVLAQGTLHIFDLSGETVLEQTVLPDSKEVILAQNGAYVISTGLAQFVNVK